MDPCPAPPIELLILVFLLLESRHLFWTPVPQYWTYQRRACQPLSHTLKTHHCGNACLAIKVMALSVGIHISPQNDQKWIGAMAEKHSRFEQPSHSWEQCPSKLVNPSAHVEHTSLRECMFCPSYHCGNCTKCKFLEKMPNVTSSKHWKNKKTPFQNPVKHSMEHLQSIAGMIGIFCLHCGSCMKAWLAM